MSSGTGNVEAIRRAVCWTFAVDKAELESHQRQRHVALPRMIAMALARRLTDLSVRQIGRLFGRAGSTVIRDCRKVNVYVEAAAQALPATATPEQWVRCVASALELPASEAADRGSAGLI